MSRSLLQNRGRGVAGAVLDHCAVQQLPDRSIDCRSSHLGSRCGLRSNRHLDGKDWRHLRCSSHCLRVSIACVRSLAFNIRFVIVAFATVLLMLVIVLVVIAILIVGIIIVVAIPFVVLALLLRVARHDGCLWCSNSAHQTFPSGE
jgi:hypothetical protein